MSYRWRWRWRCGPKHGQATVEAAVTMFVYLLLLQGLVEGALMAYSLGVLGHAAHDGARYAAVPSTPSASSVQARVAGTTSDMMVPIQAADVVVQTKDANAVSKLYSARVTGDRVSVSATYQYPPITLLILAGTLPLTRSTEIMVE